MKDQKFQFTKRGNSLQPSSLRVKRCGEREAVQVEMVNRQDEREKSRLTSVDMTYCPKLRIRQ